MYGDADARNTLGFLYKCLVQIFPNKPRRLRTMDDPSLVPVSLAKRWWAFDFTWCNNHEGLAGAVVGSEQACSSIVCVVFKL